jgi:hypothetical protein
MTPIDLEQLASTVGRTSEEASEVVAFAESLKIPEESLTQFLEATAELATVADREREEADGTSWLRMAKRVAAYIGFQPKPTVKPPAEAPPTGRSPLIAAPPEPGTEDSI